MEQRILGRSGLRSSVLGLGCSRIGSALAAGGPARAERAVEAALAAGITLFDTADIYGQGDSERILGRVLRRSGVAAQVATKAGFLLPAPGWMLRLAKPVLRLAAGRSAPVGGAASRQRARGYRQDFAPARLERMIAGSLRRLDRPIDLFLLHSPSPALAGSEALLRFLERMLAAGRVGAVGVSCAGEAADLAWLAAPHISAVQIPLRPGQATPFLTACATAGIGVIAREFARGQGESGIGAALAAVLATPGVSAALIGSTDPAHIAANAHAAPS